MSFRITFASLATALVLGGGALVGGSIASSTSAEAAPGWRGGHGGSPIVDPGFIRRGHGGWGRPSWDRRGWGGHGGYRPAYAGFYGGCYTVIKARFVPGIGLVERPVTRCR